MLTTETTPIALTAKLLRGFGDPSRLAILDTLRGGPLTVGAIVTATGLTQPNVSNHLGCLRDCGLVTATPHGRQVTYQLSDDRVGDLIALAETLTTDVALGLATCTRYNLSTAARHG